MMVGQPTLELICRVVPVLSSYSIRVGVGWSFLFLRVDNRPNSRFIQELRRKTVIPPMSSLPLRDPFPGVMNLTVTPFLPRASPRRRACISAPPAGSGGKEAAIMITLIRSLGSEYII